MRRGSCADSSRSVPTSWGNPGLKGDNVLEMRNIIRIIAAVPLFALVASATDWPKSEVFLGYSFVRFNPNSGYIPSFNANGGYGQFQYNVNRWFSGVIDAGAVAKGELNGFDISTTIASVTAGPRFTYRNHTRF